MALTRTATAATLRDVYEHSRPTGTVFDAATVVGYQAGSTAPPAGFTLPAFSVVYSVDPAAQGAHLRARYYGKLNIPPPQPSPPRYYATLVKTASAGEGNNSSIYVGVGVYDTNYAFQEGDYREFDGRPEQAANFMARWTSGKPRVFFVMPETIALANKAAEEEHCSDFIRAYDLTLGVADAALTAMNGQRFGPCASQVDALAAVTAAFKARVPEPLRSLGMDMAKWGEKYLELADKSRRRDRSNWHSWGLELITTAGDHTSWPHELLTGLERPDGGRVYVRYTAGTSQVALHSSASIINY